MKFTKNQTEGGATDGITTAPEMKELMAVERAVWVETQRAILVHHVAQLAGVSEQVILSPLRKSTMREEDARRIAVMLSVPWLGRGWTDVELSKLWGYAGSGAMNHTRARHQSLCQTDRTYRALAERVAMALKRERDGQEVAS